jgi:hypothetical protein
MSLLSLRESGYQEIRMQGLRIPEYQKKPDPLIF